MILGHCCRCEGYLDELNRNRLRRVIPNRIVLPFIKAQKGGVDTSIDKLEAHYLAGGNVDNVVDALIAANRADIPLPFERRSY